MKLLTSTPRPNMAQTCWTALIMIMAVLFHPAAQAFVGNNLTCASTPLQMDRGTLAPGDIFTIPVSLDCNITRRFPVGANITYNAQYSNGTPLGTFVVMANGQQVSRGGLGTTGTTCMPNGCTALPVGTRFTISTNIYTRAVDRPGPYFLQFNYAITSIGGYENWSEWVYSGLVQYTVANPACRLNSTAPSNVYFGTLSNAETASASQVANIAVNCQSASTIRATLTPTQAVVNAAQGLSATTLSGLSMASTWADTNSPVALGSARSIALAAGTNNLSLRFQPRLNNAGAPPTGNFSSQYTLTLTYP
ncbi:fimbrial protein [Pseudomonas wayambapalatensis]|uniref:fimbrial protein n=1 Tax=Pseudomonas wayambapalatensis TaxID=485895 RepID=UPI003CF06C48